MRFRLHAADSETGHESTFEIECESVQQARQQAKSAGYLVSSIEPLSAPANVPPQSVGREAMTHGVATSGQPEKKRFLERLREELAAGPAAPMKGDAMRFRIYGTDRQTGEDRTWEGEYESAEKAAAKASAAGYLVSRMEQLGGKTDFGSRSRATSSPSWKLTPVQRKALTISAIAVLSVFVVVFWSYYAKLDAGSRKAGGQPDSSGPTATATPQRQAPSKQVDRSRTTISRSSLGDVWPFTVDSGLLAANPTGRLGDGTLIAEVTFTTGGKTYWVNGIAKGTHKYNDLYEIWADDPKVPRELAIKKDMGPIIDMGLRLAEGDAQPIVSPAPVPVPSVVRRPTEVRTDPDLLFNGRVPIWDLEFNGIKLNDSESKIPASATGSGSLRLSDGFIYKLDNGRVISISVRNNAVLDALQIKSEADIRSRFGNPDDTVHDDVLLTTYKYRKRQTTVIWVTKDQRLETIVVGKT